MNTLTAMGMLDLSYLNLSQDQPCYFQLSPVQLTAFVLNLREGVLTDGDVLAIDTGEFTGRSPKDRYIVKDALTAERVDWGSVNIPMNNQTFDRLYHKVSGYLEDKSLFVRDGFTATGEESRLSLRVVTETAYQNLFAYNLFIRPDKASAVRPEWTIVAAPGFKANPEQDGTRQSNFSIINFSRRLILIGGTGYTGEIKKAVFSVLNFLLPQQGVLPMHCAANIGREGDTAIFFGLSGTGKTTLSADPARQLIGDDEHGWNHQSIFNFEGGCYAKTIGINPQHEPQIHAAIRPGALLENICFDAGTRAVNFKDGSKTENTRVSYPIEYISNALLPSVGPTPKNIFFLTADAFGVLPPVAKLNKQQALYYFLLGYTAKVAGTEHGINEPQATFSACFGKAFLPLAPQTYARLLNERLRDDNINIWLINTGWTGGPYGTGERIKLEYTRSIISAAINGDLNHIAYKRLPIFELEIPQSCPGVPAGILDPSTSWADKAAYHIKATELLQLFTDNYARL